MDVQQLKHDLVVCYMVSVKVKGDETYYICEACGFTYTDERWAKQCEAYCLKHQSCSLAITQHAVEIESFK
jgi:hypothetical protein